MLSEHKYDKNTKEEENTMASIAKPNTRAFILSPDKVGKFTQNSSVAKKSNGSFLCSQTKRWRSNSIKRKKCISTVKKYHMILVY